MNKTTEKTTQPISWDMDVYNVFMRLKGEEAGRMGIKKLTINDFMRKLLVLQSREAAIYDAERPPVK